MALDVQAREVALDALRQVALAAVVNYVGRVFEQVEARLAGGETAGVAYPEALRHELERLRRGVEQAEARDGAPPQGVRRATE